MRNIYLILLAIFVASGAWAQNGNAVKLTGRVTNEQGEKIDFATVVLQSLADTSRMIGGVSDNEGQFTLQAPAGNYRLQVSFVGFQPDRREVALRQSFDLGSVVLRQSAVAIDDVVVRGVAVRRDADRFVVDVANSPVAIGKDALEMLAVSPGVWVRDGSISVNGRGGTQIMINDRLLQLSGAELASYLRNIKAEDIQRIEVIPYAGADHDASAAGGVVKITLRRQVDEGLEGGVSMLFSRGPFDGQYLSPSLNLKYKVNKLSLYTYLSYGNYHGAMRTEEYTRYKQTDMTIDANGGMNNRGDTYNETVGLIYDISQKHSVGFEANFHNNREHGTTFSHLLTSETGGDTRVESIFKGKQRTDVMNLSGNYIVRLDTVGSTFKLLLDYSRLGSERPTLYESAFRGFTDRDTTYHGQADATYDIAAVTTHLDWALSPSTMIKGGLKYSFNKMQSVTLYQYMQGDNWLVYDPQSSRDRYTEQVAAAYVNFSTRFKNNIAINAGLRGEYTYADPASNKVSSIPKQNYFNLFPTVNVSFPLGKSGDHSVVLGYGRKILRPGFWNLNPYRYALSEYSYQEGNPNLRPTFIEDYTLTWIFDQKYTIGFSANLVKDANMLIGTPDPENTKVILYKQVNVANNNVFSMNVNLPFQFLKWWSLDVAIDGYYQKNNAAETTRSIWGLDLNLNSVVTLAPGVFWELYFGAETPYYFGNIHFGSYTQTNTSLKKNFSKNRFTASIFVNNLFDSASERLTVNDVAFRREGYVKTNFRSFGASFRYNFKAGKSVNDRQVESGAREEKSRM